MYQLKRKKRVALYYLLDVLNNENNISTGIRLNFFFQWRGYYEISCAYDVDDCVDREGDRAVTRDGRTHRHSSHVRRRN